MPLRDIVIVAMVIMLALIALRRPWIGVMNWTWLAIMNPHRYAWGFAYNAPLAAIAGASTLLGLLLTKDKQSPFKGAPTIWLLLFAIWMTISWQLGHDPQRDYAQWDKVMKIFLMTFVTLSLLHNRHQIMAFIWVTIGSLAFLAAKGGLFTVLTGGDHRVWGPKGSAIADNNEFALATLVALPLLHFLQLQLPPGRKRHIMTVVILLSAAAAVGSHSRGALLALIAIGFVFWLRSSRKALISAMILVVTLAILPMMPEHYWERMETIKTYEEDASARGRLNAWAVAIGVASHKLTGAGMNYDYGIFYQMYGIYDTNVYAAHSIYFQVLGNHGYIGLLLYLGIWISTYVYAGRLRKLARQHSEAKWAGELGAMAQVSLIGFAVGGTFLSLAYFDMTYNIMVMVVLAKKWVELRGWETDPKESFLEYTGLDRIIRLGQPRRRWPANNP